MSRIAIILVVLVAAAALFFVTTLGNTKDDFEAGAKVFRIPLENDPKTLDPIKVTDVDSDGMCQKLYNTLIRLDKDLRPQPELCSEMPVWDAAEKSFTFKLRTDVRFHNGRPMTARDVKYSWERLLDANESARPVILKSVVGAQELLERKTDKCAGLEVVDEHTFKVRLLKEDPIFLVQISMVNAAVIPEEAVLEAQASHKTFSAQPVGTGPFKLSRWDYGRRIVLRRHETYFKGASKLDGMICELVPEPQTRLEKFMKGEFHVSDIPFGRLKVLEQEQPDLIKTNSSLRTNYLGLLLNRKAEDGTIVPVEPLGTNLKLRQAINHAVNRQYICETILEGQGIPAQSVLPPGLAGHDPEIKGWSYDVEKAKALLAEAGYPGGEGLKEFDFYYRKDPDIEQTALAIQNNLGAIGVKVNLRSLEWNAFLEKVYKDPPEMFFLGWVADYPDAENFIDWLFHTSQWGEPGNETRYHNPEVDKLLEEARTTMDSNARLKLLNRAEKIIVEQDVGWVLLYWKVNKILLSKHAKGVAEQLCPLDVGHGLNHVDFSKVDLE